MPRYRRPQSNNLDPYKSQPLPLGKPVAVYYRQSSEGQIGNISTTLQTVDMVEHLMRQGWAREQVIMIDMDAGVSGTRKIEDRPGMSRLYSLITNNQIGLCAAQDVDRFFRDVTQIETNIFIDACRRHNVQVLTPTFVYDFAHPTQGRYHMQMFREQAQRAADFIEFHVKGRLLKSRAYLAEQGMWVGNTTPIGYMVDNRERLPDGQRNPNWRRFVPYRPHADIVLAYFELFKQYNGNFKRCWEHIEAHGPFIPEVTEEMLPSGHRIILKVRTRSRKTGQIVISRDGFHTVLTNANYIGLWSVEGVIVKRNNHEPIVPIDLFMYAFNRLSATDFNGDPNPDYIPHRPYNRHADKPRPVESPTYGGVLFSPEIDGETPRRMSCSYIPSREAYNYVLTDPYNKAVHLNMTASVVDAAIDDMLKARLEATAVDESAWKAAVEATHSTGFSDVRRIKQAIQSAEKSRTHVIDNLKAVSHPELVKSLEDSFVAIEHELEHLRAELNHLESLDTHAVLVLEARPVIQTVVAHWQIIPARQRRELFDAFAHRAILTRVDLIRRNVTIEWRDGIQTIAIVVAGNRYISWSQAELSKLRQMVEDNADQIDILRTFPGVTWHTLRERYRYHFGDQDWASVYRGRLSYGRETRWQDTREYRVEAAQISASSVPPISKPCSRMACPSAPSPPPPAPNLT